MNGAKLSKEVTKRGREIAACEVFIDIGKGLSSIATVDYDEKKGWLVIIPEAKSKAYNKKKVPIGVMFREATDEEEADK